MKDGQGPHFLDGGGRASDDIRSVDWGSTSLGPLRDWPVALKIAVGMMVSSRFPKAIFWGPDLLMMHNDAFRPILGTKSGVTGRPMHDVWAEVWPDIKPFAERAMNGEPTFLEDLELEIDRGEQPETCFFTFCYSPIRDEAGTVSGFIDTVIETTGRVKAERALKVMNAELSHRIQNTLSTVESIARSTLKNATTPNAAWQVLSARLRALAETHAILRPGGASLTDIGAVVGAALRPHLDGTTRFAINGPDLEIGVRQAVALSLALNELTTNAIKYGALSADGGRVAIDWGVTADGGVRRFLFSWREEGGPPVSVPDRVSFGTTLLASVVPSDFAGEAELRYDPGGFTYDLACDCGNLTD